MEKHASSHAHNPPPVITGPHPEGGWQVTRPHAKRPSHVTQTKADAVELGKTIAQNEGAEHIIQNENGEIHQRNSYGKTETSAPDKDGKK